MIGSANHYRIDLLVHIVKHFAKVMELRHARVLVKRCSRAATIYIAECDDVFSRNALQVRRTSPAGANNCNVELLVGRRTAPTAGTSG
jgi:hypothetical protein